LSKLLRQLNQI